MSATQVNYTQAPTGPEAPSTDPTKDINAQATSPATTTGGGDNTDRPSWLPQQFDTVEAYVKSTNDTRAELTRAQQELAKLRKGDTGTKPEGQTGAEQSAQTETERAASEAVANAGIDVSTWQAEFNETLDVSEEGRAKIADALKGQFGEQARALVDDFIEGQKVRVTNARDAAVKQAHDIAGGGDNYTAMVNWAGTNLSEKDCAAYDAAMNSGDLNTIALAVDGLRARYERANGSSPSLISGDGSIGNTNVGFASTHEMTKAMSDPRYSKDPVYRKSVEQKAMRSNF